MPADVCIFHEICAVYRIIISDYLLFVTLNDSKFQVQFIDSFFDIARLECRLNVSGITHSNLSLYEIITICIVPHRHTLLWGRERYFISSFVYRCIVCTVLFKYYLLSYTYRWRQGW